MRPASALMTKYDMLTLWLRAGKGVFYYERDPHDGDKMRERHSLSGV